MTLLTQIEKLLEEFKTEKDLVALFKDAKDDNTLQVYVLAETYDVRPLKEGEKIKVHFPGVVSKTETALEGDFLLRIHERPNLQRLIDNEELDSYFAPVRSHEKPDAENFTLYRSTKTIQAFQYAEDVALVIQGNAGKTLKINPNDYIARDTSNLRKVFVMPGSKFENKYTLSK